MSIVKDCFNNRVKNCFKIYSHFYNQLIDAAYFQLSISNVISIDNESLYFTNFLSPSSDYKQIDALISLNDDIKSEVNIFAQDKYTIADFIPIYSQLNRLKKIAKQYNYKINSFKNILKCKCKSCPSFQIYCETFPTTNSLEIFLIDTHHLGLKDGGQNMKSDYLKHKNKKECISQYISKYP